MRIPLASQAYVDSVPDNHHERLVNMYPVLSEGPGRSEFALVRIPGSVSFSKTSGAFRGAIEMSGKVYVVAGSSLWELSSDGTASSVATVPGSERVSMAHNGGQLAIAANDTAYIWTSSGGLQSVVPGGLTVVKAVTWLDQRFVWTGNSGQFAWSDVGDGLANDPLNFATAERAPDELLLVIADHGELWAFGSKTIEVWRSTGDSNAPFARALDASPEKGISSKDAVVQIDNSIFWLGSDGAVYRANGYQPVRVSTFSIEKRIAGADVIAFSWVWNGHQFATFHADGVGTFAYDAATQRWFELESWNMVGWRMRGAVDAFGKQLVFTADGETFRLDDDTHTEAGDPIRWLVDLPYVHNEGRSVFGRFLELSFRPGVGLDTGQGSDPKVMLSWSDDGGRIFSSEFWRPIGKGGEYDVRARWFRLGRFRRRIFRAVGSDPVRWEMIAAYLEAIGGR